MFLCLIDLFILTFCYVATSLCAYYFSPVTVNPGLILPALGILIASYCLVFGLFRINHVIWRTSNEIEYLKVFLASLGVGEIFFVAVDLLGVIKTNVMYYVLATLLGGAMICLSRIVYKAGYIFRMERDTENPEEKENLLIVGAGYAGTAILNDILVNKHTSLIPVGFVDDDVQKQGRSIQGAKIFGGVEDIPQICREHNVSKIYIAIPTASNSQRSRILNECAKTSCSVKILPPYSEIETADDNKLVNLVRDITPEELLGREPINVADENIYQFVGNKTVLITGGGGSIGSELCRQIAEHSPKRLVIIDIYENNAYAIQQELKNKYGNSLNLMVYIASVRDAKKLNYLFSIEKPDIVFHAAAHKHVPLMEDSPDEAIKNNIFGTFNSAMAAKNNGVKRFVLISTDKAVNPTNIMGASKRMCEMVIQYFDHISENTTYAAVRFGNVLGSNGSVIPLFKEQIAARHDITVTDPRIIRYFMTIPEASQLVLTAGAMAQGGEIFVLDMGEPVKIDDLARKMISLSGLTIGVDINIKYIGLRPGEKLYEELLMSEEGLKSTLNKKIFISSILPVDFNVLQENLDLMHELVSHDRVTPEEVEKLMMKAVPTFKRFVPDETVGESGKEKEVASKVVGVAG